MGHGAESWRLEERPFGSFDKLRADRLRALRLEAIFGHRA
jgi:hypothetical protein